MPGTTQLLAFASLAAYTTAVHAHHSPIAFDAETTVRISGTVTRFDWTNPHVYIYVRAEDASGANVDWQLESDWTNDLIRAGWTPESLVPGDLVTIEAHPSRSARLRYANLISLEKANGTILSSWDLGERTERPAATQATGLSGRWLPEQGFPAFFRASTEQVNAAGALAQESYREAENPGIACTPHPLPTRLGMPHVNEIAVHDDRVVIVSESDRVPRVIYTDGRGHPPSGDPSLRGHSVGRWQGEVLVVETTTFSNHRRGNGFAVPSSREKSLTERYERYEDGSALTLSYVLSDPEYFSADVSGTFVWRYAPDLDLIPYSCDLEVARRYLGIE